MEVRKYNNIKVLKNNFNTPDAKLHELTKDEHPIVNRTEVQESSAGEQLEYLGRGVDGDPGRPVGK